MWLLIHKACCYDVAKDENRGPSWTRDSQWGRRPSPVRYTAPPSTQKTDRLQNRTQAQVGYLLLSYDAPLMTLNLQENKNDHFIISNNSIIPKILILVPTNKTRDKMKDLPCKSLNIIQVIQSHWTLFLLFFGYRVLIVCVLLQHYSVKIEAEKKREAV